jgi:hypothetical protein
MLILEYPSIHHWTKIFFVLKGNPKPVVVVPVVGGVVVAVSHAAVLGVVVPTASTQNTVAILYVGIDLIFIKLF